MKLDCTATHRSLEKTYLFLAVLITDHRAGRKLKTWESYLADTSTLHYSIFGGCPHQNQHCFQIWKMWLSGTCRQDIPRRTSPLKAPDVIWGSFVALKQNDRLACQDHTGIKSRKTEKLPNMNGCWKSDLLRELCFIRPDDCTGSNYTQRHSEYALQVTNELWNVTMGGGRWASLPPHNVWVSGRGKNEPEEEATL